jgi:hypothetical protein
MRLALGACMEKASSGARSVALALLCCVGLVTGCGRAHLGSDEDRSYVIFSNQTMDQVTVYAAVPNSEMRRIGTVMGGRTDTLEVARSLTGRGGGINILARALASNRMLQTGPVSFGRGDWMSVELPPSGLTLAILPAP